MTSVMRPNCLPYVATFSMMSASTSGLAEAVAEAKTRAKETDTFDIFLSHSIRDAELVTGVVLLLKERGFSVYVDWNTDPQLDRSAVSRETAAVLRKRMRQCKALLFVATENASSSKWMPWELGYFVLTKDKYSSGVSDVFVEDFGRQWMPLAKFGKATGTWQSYGQS